MGTHYPLVYRFVHTNRDAGVLYSLDDGSNRESCAVLYPCFAVDYDPDGKAVIYVAKYAESIAPVSTRLDVSFQILLQDAPISFPVTYFVSDNVKGFAAMRA